jgi:hypothetical protein
MRDKELKSKEFEKSEIRTARLSLFDELKAQSLSTGSPKSPNSEIENCSLPSPIHRLPIRRLNRFNQTG